MTAPLVWQWSNPDRTEARAGAWIAVVRESDTALRHDDFMGGDAPLWTSKHGYGATATNDDLSTNWIALTTLHEVLGSFTRWAKTQPQPVTLEHREGEYVHLAALLHEGLSVVYEFSDGIWHITHNDAVEGWPVGHTRSTSGMNESVKIHPVISHGFLAPGTITKAAPPEPTGFGFVGTVVAENGDEWDVTTHKGERVYTVTRQRDGKFTCAFWDGVLALGTFEAVVR